MKKYAILLLNLLILISCQSDDPIQYKLSTQVNPEEGGTVIPSSGTFDEGEEITLTAIPGDEYAFKNWSDDASGNELNISLVMTDDMFVTANFVRTYPLTIEIWGEGTVKEEVIQAKSTTDYPSGTTVQLTATPEDGWIFDSWEVVGQDIFLDNPLTIQITRSQTIWARFEPFDEKKVYIPDDNFEKALIEMGLDDKLDDYVYAQRLKNVKELNLENREIEDLTGIQHFEFLNKLNLSNNNLSSLDLSHNWFESVVVIGNPQLTCVQFHKNQLYYIQPGVDWFIADEGVTPSVDCTVTEDDLTYVPDDAFEMSLILLGLDIEMDDYVRTIDIVNVIELNLSGKNISDISGIEDFKALWVIDLNSNNISDLDMTNLWPFRYLDARNNPLNCIQIDPLVLNIDGIPQAEILVDAGVELTLDCGN